MNVKERYESAKEIYAAIGVDTDKAVETLENIAISMLFLKMVNLRTETKSSRSISKNGLILRRKKESALISTPPSSPTAR